MDGVEEIEPAASFHLGDGEGGRQHSAAGVGLAFFVRVVGLIGVRRHAVRQRRLDERRSEIGTHDRCLLALAEGGGVALAGDASFERRARNDGGKAVDDVDLGL
jgi:hypothetical protein